MGNTLKIRKSKYLSYQKQGFLYLVFILFLFFSQAGEYVIHYLSLAKTQGELNEYLEGRLSSLILEDEQDDQYRQDVLERVSALKGISQSFEQYENQSIAGLDQFRENQFAERKIRRGEYGMLFDNLWLQQQEQSSGTWTQSELVDYEKAVYSPTNFFFKETPNAVVPSLVEHAKTAFLVEALQDLNEQALVLEKYRMERLEEADFVSVYKKRLFLGETFTLELKPTEESDSVVTVSINGEPQALRTTSSYASIAYRPRIGGKYFVEIQTLTQRFYTSFEVVRPSIRFIVEDQLIDLTLGEEQQISIDERYLPSSGVSFVSEYATTSYEDGILTVVPTTVGEFALRLTVDSIPQDSIVLGARAPELLTVVLADASGRESSMANAHRVQSVNPNFQVLSYTAQYYPKDGTQPKKLQSLSRLIRPDMMEWSQQSGTLVIDNISLLSSDGTTKVNAQPLIVSSNE